MATKPTGRPHGGRRPGAGRPKGSKSRRRPLAEILPKLEEKDRQLPLYRLLDRIADDSEDIRYRDMLTIAALPYMHGRMTTRPIAKAPFELDETMARQQEHERELARGRGSIRVK